MKRAPVIDLAGIVKPIGSLRPIVSTAASIKGLKVLETRSASVGDAAWFGVGKIKGEALVKGYCRLSLGSRDCVRRTREMFSRFPRTSLLLGKFVPGLSPFVVPVAGFSGMPYTRFLVADVGGIVLWAASMIGIGYSCGDRILNFGKALEESKWVILAMAGVILTCYYGFKAWRLRRFGRAELGEVP